MTLKSAVRHTLCSRLASGRPLVHVRTLSSPSRPDETTSPVDSGSRRLPRPPHNVALSASQTRSLTAAGSSVAIIVTSALPLVLGGPGDTTSAIIMGAGVVGLPILFFAHYHVPKPAHALPKALIGGLLTGCIAAPFAWDIATFAPSLVPFYACATLAPALIGTQVGTRLTESLGASSESFGQAVSAFEFFLIFGVVVAFTKYAIDRTAPPAPADAAALTVPRAILSMSMSAAGAAWWALFVRQPITSPLSAALFSLLLAASPTKEVALAFTQQVHRASMKPAGTAESDPSASKAKVE